MKKKLFLELFGIAILVLTNIQLSAQIDINTRTKIEKCIQDYQDLSGLGNPGSMYIDSATISAFKDLFESNANIYWDLFKTGASKTNYLLPVDEYVDSVNLVYSGLKPVVSYGRYDIKINPDGKTAIIYLIKTNSIPDEKSLQKQKFTRNIITLRILLNLHDEAALIQNIARDTRLTRIRALYLSGGYPFITDISSKFSGHLVSNIDPPVTAGYSVNYTSGYCFGMTADIRIDRQTADGVLFNVGLVYTKNNFDIKLNDYIYSYRQTFDRGDNAFECTVFDRTPSISEKISLSSISMPLTIKWYLFKKHSGKRPLRNQDPAQAKKIKKPRRLKYYVKAGPQLNLLSGKSNAAYTLSHTGGGMFIYESEKNIPDPGKTWFYLDENNERRDGPNFFSQRLFSYSSSINLYKVYVSAVVAIGIEVKFNKILVGFEPWLNIGITTVSGNKGNPGYQLYPTGYFTSFVETSNSPRINSFGLTVLIGKIFNRKY